MNNGVDTNGRWRISKDIPISFVAVAILQTIGFAVWLTDLGGTVKSIVVDNAASKATAYTKDEARKDRELIDLKLLFVQNKEEEITRRTALVEAAVNELKARQQK